MANEFYTLIVVPHAKARFRKFQVSVRLTRWVLGAFGVLALILCGILTHYTWISVEVGELRHLRAENLALATKARAYEENAGRLQAKVLTLQGIVTKLGVMAGVEQSLPDSQVAGVGGLLPDGDDGSIRGRGRLPARPRQDGQQPDREVDPPRELLPGPAPAARLDAVHLAGARLPVGAVRQPQGPLHRAARLPPGHRHRDPARDEGGAPADGVVVYCGEKGGYGNAMVIDHGYGVVTRYAHLDRFAVRPGPAGPARRRDRLHRQHRPVDGTSPPLRGVGVRPDAQPDPVHPGRVPLLRLDEGPPAPQDPAGRWHSRTGVGILSRSREREHLRLCRPPGGPGQVPVASPGEPRANMINAILTRIFGTKNERELKRIRPMVQQVGQFEPAPAGPRRRGARPPRPSEFQGRLAQGTPLDDLLPEAFAVVREAGRRVLRHAPLRRAAHRRAWSFTGARSPR